MIESGAVQADMQWSRQSRSRRKRASVDREVADALQEYAERGVFRGFSVGLRREGRTTFTVLWHYGRVYRFILDAKSGLVSFPDLLPGVPARSAMFRELHAFLAPFSTDAVPEHRRIDPSRGELRVRVVRGALSLSMVVRAHEYVWCTKKLVHLAHDVFMVFLRDGPYFEYRVRKLGLDPESVLG